MPWNQLISDMRPRMYKKWDTDGHVQPCFLFRRLSHEAERGRATGVNLR